MKKYAIIVAGGKGLRMNTEVPKQFIPLKGKPLLMYTLEAFVRYDDKISLILVLPSFHQEYWRSLCKQYNFVLSHQVVTGGENRFQSVKNGLNLIPEKEESLVAVHDGVRPFVNLNTIEKAFEGAEKYGAVVPVIDSVDSIRELDKNGSKATDRSKLKLVQTPQIFKSTLLKKSYLQEFDSIFTDDASVVEHCGYPIFLTEGNRKNIKITTPFDLLIAETLLNKIDLN